MGTNLANVRVLVVEDHEDCRLVITRLLERQGAIVDAVECVDEALLEVDDFIPDVVVSDLGMPEQDGFELIHALRERIEKRSGLHIPALAVSGLPEKQYRPKSLAAGFEAFMPKPFDPKGLVAEIGNLASGLHERRGAPRARIS